MATCDRVIFISAEGEAGTPAAEGGTPDGGGEEAAPAERGETQEGRMGSCISGQATQNVAVAVLYRIRYQIRLKEIPHLSWRLNLAVTL